MRLGAALIGAAAFVTTEARAANEDGVPLSTDAMLAGTSLATHDGSTGAWYNPAALGGLPRSSVQVSTSIYTLGVRQADGLLETRLPAGFAQPPSSLSSVDFTTIPSGISFVFRLGERFGLSLGLFSPVREYFTVDSAFSTSGPAGRDYNQTFALSSRTDSTQGALGFGWALTPRLRLGAAVLLTQDTVETVTDFSISLPVSGMRAANAFLGVVSRTNASHFGFRGVVGAQWDVARWLTVAAAVRSPVAGFAASGREVTSSYIASTVSAPPIAAFEQTILDAQPIPLAAPLRGYWGAQTRFGPVRLALEGDVRHPIDDAGCGGSNQAGCTAGADKWVANARLGAIVQATDNVWIGAGGFTDMDGHSLEKSGRSIDFFGGTAGVQFRSPSVVRLRAGGDPWDLRTTLAVRYAAGVGQLASTLVDLAQTGSIARNPVPASALFHEISFNIATGLEF